MRMQMMIPKMRKGLVGWAVTAPGGPSNFLESTQEPPEQASQSLITLGSASFRGGGGRSTPFHSFWLVGLLVGHTEKRYLLIRIFQSQLLFCFFFWLIVCFYSETEAGCRVDLKLKQLSRKVQELFQKSQYHQSYRQVST